LRHALLAVVLALPLAGCGGHAPEPPSRPAAARGLLVVRRSLVDDLKPVAATVTTRDMAEARARIGGVLVRLDVREGDWVRRGQLIGVVSDARIGFETRAYAAQAAAAQAEAVRAQADLGRIRDLYSHGVYAKARLDQAEAAARAARGMADAARAQTGASAALAGQGAIVAPAEGRVLHADVPAGSVVTPGMSVATLTAGPAVLRAEIPEADASGLRVGEAVPLLDDAGRALGTASVTQVYPAVTAGRIVADLTGPGLDGGAVGRRVRLRLPTGRRPALMIPRRYVISRFGVDYVRVRGRDGGFADAPVQLASEAAGDQVEVLSGVAAGDVLALPEPGR
jgi:RND family efflux transporter MFP subunit